MHLTSVSLLCGTGKLSGVGPSPEAITLTSSCQCFVIPQQSLCLEEAEGKIEPCFYLLIHDVDHAGNARFTVYLSLLLNLEVNYIMGLDYCDRFTTLSAGLVLIVYAL